MRGIQKYVLVLLSALFAIGAIFSGVIYSKNRLPKEAIETPTKTSTTKKADQELTVNDLFNDSTQVFLAPSISDSDIEQVKSNLADDQDQQTLLNTVMIKWAIQKKLNQLFEEPVLIGDKLNESAAVASSVSEADKELVLSELASSGLADGFAMAVQSALSGSASGGSITEEEVAEKLKDVVNEGQVVQGFSMEGYVAARDAVKNLPEGTRKSEMQADLKLVEDVLISMGYDLTQL